MYDLLRREFKEVVKFEEKPEYLMSS